MGSFIVDKRKSGKNKFVNNRRRFIERYKKYIEESINSAETVITNDSDTRKVRISKKNIKEPQFTLDPNTGRRTYVNAGNKTFKPGDYISRSPPSSSGRGGSNSGEGEDEFSFVLTKEEFIDLYFKDMELPNFVKKSLKDSTKLKLVRNGFSKEGIPPRLDLVKTFKQAIGRRIATGSNRYLEDIDMRYKYFVEKPYPVLHARIFFLMDVSGSMGEFEKLLAKKFFLLFFLFLQKNYEKVEVTFIRHTTDARVCDEREFFYSHESGGTIVSSGLELVNNIINSEINLSETNVYVAQASDGDNWDGDMEPTSLQMQELLNKVQYFAYIQTESEESVKYKKENEVKDLLYLYKSLLYNEKLNVKLVSDLNEIYPVLRELFAKE